MTTVVYDIGTTDHAAGDRADGACDYGTRPGADSNAFKASGVRCERHGRQHRDASIFSFGSPAGQ